MPSRPMVATQPLVVKIDGSFRYYALVALQQKAHILAIAYLVPRLESGPGVSPHPALGLPSALPFDHVMEAQVSRARTGVQHRHVLVESGDGRSFREVPLLSRERRAEGVRAARPSAIVVEVHGPLDDQAGSCGSHHYGDFPARAHFIVNPHGEARLLRERVARLLRRPVGEDVCNISSGVLAAGVPDAEVLQ